MTRSARQYEYRPTSPFVGLRRAVYGSGPGFKDEFFEELEEQSAGHRHANMRRSSRAY